MSNRRKRQETFRVISKAIDALEKMIGKKFPKKGLDRVVSRLFKKGPTASDLEASVVDNNDKKDSNS